MHNRWKYSFDWAWGVYDRYSQTCPRATEICLDLFGLVDQHVVQFLAEGSIRWEKWKYFTKRVDGILQRALSRGWNDTRIRGEVRAEVARWTREGWLLNK